MKIEKIEIHNYKAFYGDQNVINVGGKNLFIYGENGSGKSSLYYALKDFFQSSMETINLNDVKNIFIDPSEQVMIRLTFKDENNKIISPPLELSPSVSPNNNINIRDTCQLRSFLTYKNLLKIHNIKKEQDINLFQLLVKGVLKHFRLTGLDKPLEEAWDDIEEVLNKPVCRNYNSKKKSKDLKEQIKKFNIAFGNLFIPPDPSKPNPDYILNAINPILQYFDRDIQIELKYELSLDMRVPNPTTLSNKAVNLDIKYAKKDISKPHLFLNEARLSAIVISIYLGMIKRLPQSGKIKILFLDDLFIGLDSSNRMPLMEILEREFSDYQIIISTYDKPWYEIIRFYLQKNPNWTSIEFLTRKSQLGYDQPLIRYADDVKSGDHVKRYIDIAEEYYNSGDNKAAGVYLRSAFEFILKRYCYSKKLKVKFEIDQSKLNTDDFWTAIKEFKLSEDTRIKGTNKQSNCQLKNQTIIVVELLRKFVLNPLCHQNQTRYEYSLEIKKTIDVLKLLQIELK